MLFYSRASLSFVRRLEQYTWNILIDEMGIKVRKTRFVCGEYTWPLEIACFEHPSTLGYFEPESLLIGVNRLLMVNGDEDFLKNLLRHELAHYICYIHHGRDMAAHGKEYRRLCRNCGWGKNVFNAKINKQEIALSLQQNQTDVKILTRIKKLMALGSSSNQHESDAATLKANELLIKYNLEKASLNPDDIDEKAYYVLVAAKAPKTNEMLRALGRILKNFMVHPVYSRKKNHTALEIIGTRLNVELASYVADFLQHEFERLWKQTQKENLHLKGIVAKNSFLRGMAKGLDEKLNAVKKHTAGNKTQLTLIKTALEEAVAMAYPHLGVVRTKTQHCPQGNALGEEAGKNISIHPGLKKDDSETVGQIH